MWRQRLLERVSAAARGRVEGDAHVDEHLGACIEACEKAWPGLGLDPGAFVDYLAERWVDAPATVDDDEAVNVLAGLHAEDLYLACACAAGLDRAIAAFRRVFALDIAKVTQRFAGPDLEPADLEQLLATKLFVGDDGAPAKILQYTGRGFLQNWLRVFAVRTFIDRLRVHARRRSQVGLDGDQVANMANADEDLELAFLKKHYRGEFKRAFGEAVGVLTSQERNLLRHRYGQGLEVGQIAQLYQMHRVTASKKLSETRAKLLAETLRGLKTSMGVDKDELASVMRLIRSNLDVSVSVLLPAHEASHQAG